MRDVPLQVVYICRCLVLTEGKTKTGTDNQYVWSNSSAMLCWSFYQECDPEYRKSIDVITTCTQITCMSTSSRKQTLNDVQLACRAMSLQDRAPNGRAPQAQWTRCPPTPPADEDFCGRGWSGCQIKNVVGRVGIKFPDEIQFQFCNEKKYGRTVCFLNCFLLQSTKSILHSVLWKCSKEFR